MSTRRKPPATRSTYDVWEAIATEAGTLDLQQLRVLALVCTQPPVPPTISETAGLLGNTIGVTSRAVYALVRAGLLVTERQTRDGRTVGLTPTDAGLAFNAKIGKLVGAE